jgi:hypothetical protein
MFVLGGVAEHSVVLKAENMAEKLEWMGKLRSCMESQKGSSTKKESDNSSTHLGTPDGAVDTGIVRRPVDPEEELRLMAQEVRDYVEAVLNSLAANIPKAVVLCQVERAKDAMLNQLYSSIRFFACGSTLCIVLFLPITAITQNYLLSFEYHAAYSSSDHPFTILVIDLMLKL